MIFAAFSTTAAKHAASAAFVLGSVVAVPSIAYADAPSPPADALFREGRMLLDSKKYDEACPKLAESQRLDPGASTLLALALCHEGQGKTATAWGELNEAAALGKRVGRADLANAAQRRATVMEPQLAKVVVRVPQSDNVAYEVKRDGEPLPARDWGAAVPVDPGEHRVDVAAKGKIARSYVVRLAGASTVEIVVDKLEDALAPVSTTQTTSAPVSLAAAPGEPAAETGRGGAQRAIGITFIGLGVVGLGVGAYFGGRALSESSEGKRTCPTTPCPAGATNDANDRAKDSFKLSVISISSGAGAIAVGAIVYLLAPSSTRETTAGKPPRTTARIVPEASPTGGSLGVVGTF